MEIALRVHETDADQRHTKIPGLLAMVAGKDAQSARVNRQRLMQRELCREVGDRLTTQLRKARRPPRVVGRPRAVQRLNRFVVVLHELRIRRGRRELLAWHEGEHPNRVMRRLPPQPIVEMAKHHARLGVPDPPEVERELVEARNPPGQRRDVRVAVHRHLLS